MVIFNASELDLDWHLPDARWGARWVVELDSADPETGTPELPTQYVDAGTQIRVTSRSLRLLRQTDAAAASEHPAKRAPRKRAPRKRAE